VFKLTIVSPTTDIWFDSNCGWIKSPALAIEFSSKSIASEYKIVFAVMLD
jgi:hypothetical protein